MARTLVEGLYEELITNDLASALDTSDAQRITEKLDDADGHEVLAAHVGRTLANVLASLPSEDRAERARLIVAQVLRYIETLVDAEAAALLVDNQPQRPAQRLLALYRGGKPERPTTPLSTSTLLTRAPDEPAIGHELAREIATADRIDAIIAFVTVSGVRALSDALHAFARREGTTLRLLTTAYRGVTEASAVELLARLPRGQVKISYATDRTRLHAKAWLFHRHTGLSTAYIGSANLTSTALGPGHEWMVKACSGDVAHVIKQFQRIFEKLWETPEFESYSPDNLDHQARLRDALSRERAGRNGERLVFVDLHPRPHQMQILDKLTVERELHNRRRNLIVAATGTGKTVIAAFDYLRQVTRNGGVAPTLLFLAHRKELLTQARTTFRQVLRDASFGELLVDGEEPVKYAHVFASIRSAATLIARVGSRHFRHVVVDECHHVPAASYQAVVPALQPDLLVGLTATPERSDAQSLLPDFDGHIAAELRLWHALDDQLLVPFEYYGISDDVDLRRVKWSRTGYDVAALSDIYTGHTARADLIAHQLVKRVNNPRDIRALGFCVSVEHARFMAERFSQLGIPSLAIDGSSSIDLRDDAPRRLRSREVNVLFTCDLYNEGVDLPFVDTLLFLRPTQSATLFLQQLGRGLRHAPGKDSCLVLDFIGRHRAEFRFDTTLSALTGIPRARLREQVSQDFPYLPSGCSMQLDAVARATVLASLEAATAGAKRLAAELRDLTPPNTSPPTLASFLDQTGRDVGDVYSAGGWTALKRNAGLITSPDAVEDEDELSRRLGFLLHIDEPDRLRAYRRLLSSRPSELSAFERARLLMLEIQLTPRGVLRAAEDTIQYLARSSNIVAELNELGDVLESRVDLPNQVYPVPEWPLALHRHYSRREIAAAVGHAKPGSKAISLQTGILQLDGTRELLFVTLDKSGKGFSPTTRYRDYVISPTLFHWETQSTASVTGTGRRYIESPANGQSFYLFVRSTPDTAFAFLGPVTYLSHVGDRPISITWRLASPIPASLYAHYSTLRPT